MIIKCPQCHEEIEVEQDWVGRKAKCPYCESKFVISAQEEPEVPLSEWSYEDLVQTVKTLGEELGDGSVSKRLSELKNDLAEIGGEIKKRLLSAGQRADERAKGELPVFLRFLFPLLNKFRKKSKDESRYGDLWNEVDTLYVKWKAIRLREDEAEAARRKEEERRQAAQKQAAEEAEAEEWARKKNAELDAAVRVLIRWVRNAGLPLAECPQFDLQPGEIVHYAGKDVDCIIPRSKGDERAGKGTLVVTNKRIVFAGESHRQQYRVSNLRDFQPSWRAGGESGSIEISTSDRRREKYTMIDPWICSFVIMYQFSEDFRSQLKDSSEEASFQYVRGKLQNYVVGHYAIMLINKYHLTPEDYVGLLYYLGSSQGWPGDERARFLDPVYPKPATWWRRMCEEHRFLRKQEPWLAKNFGIAKCR